MTLPISCGWAVQNQEEKLRSNVYVRDSERGRNRKEWETSLVSLLYKSHFNAWVLRWSFCSNSAFWRNVSERIYLSIRGQWNARPDVVPAAEMHLSAAWWKDHPDGLTCVSSIRIMTILFTSCTKCTKGMWLCVLEHVCVCVYVGRGHVYLPSPLFLLLPDWPFVRRHRLGSVCFSGQMQL